MVKKLNKDILTIFFLFIFSFGIYFLSSPGETFYNYFARLSNSFVGGKLYISENPTWLNELVPINGKYYVVYPPMPAILMIPVTFIFRDQTPQTLFSILIGSINVVLVYLLLKKLKFGFKTSFLVSLFFGFGTNHWYLSSVGSAWFIAHVVALFFLLLAMLESVGKRRLFLIGLLFGASFWARTPVLFTILFFYIYLYKLVIPVEKVDGKIKFNLDNLTNFMILNLGVSVFFILDILYNYLRFGNFSPLAPYNLIPGLENDPVFKDGFMSISFIPRHIEAFFLKLPEYQQTFPYFKPSYYATALWFSSPLIFYILNFRKNILTLACWFGILPALIIIFMWAGVGYAQWGYRFAQDFMPFLLVLIALGIGNKPSKLAYSLLGLSILINLWGTIFINKFNIYTF